MASHSARAPRPGCTDLIEEEAARLLLAIEGQAADILTRSRRVLEIFLTRVYGQQPGAQAGGASAPGVPSIQDLERYARHWRTIVPTDPEARAALAHRLGQRYAFARSDIPTAQQVIGVDEADVQEAYRRRYGAPIRAIFARRPRPRDDRGRALGPRRDRQPSGLVVEDLLAEVEWVSLSRGQVLCRQGDPSDCMYFLASGRLQAVVEDVHGAVRPVTQLERGDTVGEMGLLTGEPRSATIYATRDSGLVELSKAAFDRVAPRHPQVLLQLTRQLTTRLRLTTAGRQSAATPLTLALLSTSRSVPLSDFAAQLSLALAGDGSVLHLSSARLDAHLGTGSAALLESDPGDGRITGWLDEQETARRFVVYEADPTPSPWTRLCLQRADRVLLVGLADADPTPGQIEHERLRGDEAASGRRTQLILLHRDARPTAGTSQWLAARDLDGHHHVELGSRASIERLARLLSGRATGLVLGGGGARGFVHLGVIRALREHGIPIDLVGGTSIGSAIAAQYALGWDDRTMLDVNRRGWIDYRPMRDYTVPIVALLSGARVAKTMAMMFGDSRIEDLRTGYFCISSDLTNGRVRVHRSGLLRKYVRASMSVPGIVPPVPDEDALLVDGGILNNLPADVMRGLCPRGTVIAVDANPRIGPRLGADFGDTLSPWRLIANRLNPRAEPLRAPTIYDILERTTMLGSVQQAAAVAGTTVDLYLHPPTDAFRMFDLASLEKIADLGYEYARPLIAAWPALASIRTGG